VTSGDAPLAIDRGGLDSVSDSTVELPAGWTDVNAGRAPSP
jgi:hypothetical protein